MTLTKEQAKKQLLAIRKKHNMAHISVPAFIDNEYKDLRKLIDQIYQAFESESRNINGNSN